MGVAFSYSHIFFFFVVNGFGLTICHFMFLQSLFFMFLLLFNQRWSLHGKCFIEKILSRPENVLFKGPKNPFINCNTLRGKHFYK